MKPKSKGFFFFIFCLFLLPCTSILHAQNSQDNYFSMDNPSEYPPYDSSQWRAGRFSLMAGHVGHSIIYGGLHGMQLKKGFALNLSNEAAFVLGSFSAFPAIINAFKGEIHPNSIWLNHHGENMGGFFGLAASGIIYGDGVSGLFDYRRETYLISSFSSIGFGALGYWLGKKPGWDDDKVSLFKHYGTMGALFGPTISALTLDDPDIRVTGVSSLIGAAGGYYFAYKRAPHTDLTRGDYVATDAFTLYNSYYAIRFFPYLEDNPAGTFGQQFIPMAMVIGSSTISQMWVRNTRLSRSQAKVLGTILGGTVGFQLLASDTWNFDDNEELLLLGGSYLLGGIGYKVILDNMEVKNLKKRGQATKASFSISPFSPVMLRNKEFNLNSGMKQSIISPSIKLNLKF